MTPELKHGFLLIDGGMGTMLQEAGLRAGELPEIWNLTHPEEVSAIHRAYVLAGADIITANTFGANARKLREPGQVQAVIAAGIACAKNAGARCVALDLGPTGGMLAPFGTDSFDDIYQLYCEAVEAGVKAGADVVIIETMADLLEAKAALLAVKEHSTLPVIVTMTYAENGRTFMGTTPRCAAATLSALGADCVGVNCSLGPDALYPVVAETLAYTDLPVAVQPNAGLPRMEGEKTVYDVGTDAFSASVEKMLEIGVTVFGGCCGTTPAYIRTLKKMLAAHEPVSRPPVTKTLITSRCNTVELDGAHTAVIGERINPTGKKKLKEALRCGDYDYIYNEAMDQEQAGAAILDVNAGLPEIDEAQTLELLTRELQAVTKLPLQIDSADPKAIARAVRIYCGKPVINSVSGREDSLAAVLPIVKKYGCCVVALTLDENGIPDTAQGRLSIAEKIVARAEKMGISRQDILIDCLTMAVSSDAAAARVTLDAVRLVKEKLHCQTVLGVSNISFGLPQRENINAAFLAAALEAGLDLPILNPLSEAYTKTVNAWRVLHAEDPDAGAYIRAYGSSSSPEVSASDGMGAGGGSIGLADLILTGRKAPVAAAAEALLQNADAMEILNTVVIPALDQVGQGFETGRIFLPQLMASAEAARAAFDTLRMHMNSEQAASKGEIVLATVQGDIHDIGKNIVKMLLQNYGYTVIDLGRDVAPVRILETVQKRGVPLVGLSALMTTTVKNMEKTIRLLRENNCDCKIMVGGAVLNPEYAKMVGADYYAKDAAQSAQIAAAVFGAETAH